MNPFRDYLDRFLVGAAQNLAVQSMTPPTKIDEWVGQNPAIVALKKDLDACEVIDDASNALRRCGDALAADAVRIRTSGAPDVNGEWALTAMLMGEIRTANADIWRHERELDPSPGSGPRP